jgi:hypothetical protein
LLAKAMAFCIAALLSMMTRTRSSVSDPTPALILRQPPGPVKVWGMVCRRCRCETTVDAGARSLRQGEIL